MPALPPKLYEEILKLFEPHFRLAGDRDAQLLPILSNWKGFGAIDWSGSARSFTARLIYQLPGDELQGVLLHLNTGYEGSQQAARLAARIDAALALASDKGADDAVESVASQLRPYYQETVLRLSAPRYQIDRRFVQLTLLLDHGKEAQGLRFTPDAQREKYDSLQRLLAEVGDRALVLLGKPGSGKTTLLRRLQLELAWEELEKGSRRTIFFVPLNGYRGASSGAPPPEPAVWLAELWQVLHPKLPPFTTLFENGRFLLLLDGLNEMPHRDKADYRERIGQWQTFLQRTMHYGNTAVFSCRSLDYSAPLGSEAIPVRQVQVEPLAADQIRAFLEAYLGDEGDSVWDTLREEGQLELYSNPFFLSLLAEQVGATGELPAGRAALLTGLVRLALQREVGERRHRLFDPDWLLSEDDVQQVLQQAWAGPFDLPQDGILIPRLATLAYAMQDGIQAGEAGQVRVPERTARDLLGESQAREIIAAGIQLNVLDKELATRELSFYHQLIQEYFAAQVLAKNPEPQRVAVPWKTRDVSPSLEETLAMLEVSEPLPALPATGWEESTILAAAMTGDPAQFVANLIPGNLPLAARCAAAMEMQVSPQLVAELRRDLITRIGDPAADLRARIVAAEALGELGDPRFERRTGAHGDYLLPPLASIPSGVYTIGDDTSQYEDERPAHQVEIAAFELGVFPVTNAEYALFMQAGGYENERWWETEAAKAWLRGESGNEGQKQSARDMQAYLQGFSDDVIRGEKTSPEQIEYWLWLKKASAEELEQQYDEWYPVGKAPGQPDYWDDSRFNHPAQPVVGVTWYEARAYCAWLSAQTGKVFTLPSEAQWEAAARGFEGRAYAYGPDFDAARCNTFETHIRRTTPAGVFPGGLTPEGIADLSGNVWEWTTTLWGDNIQQPTFSYPYVATDGREELQNAVSRRVVRGGSWVDNRNLARAAYRGDDHPAGRSHDLGFRVVVRRPPSQNDH
ncbi:MAG: SUMF1/EgtB/PvdO family nonheme iron enzyme [Chloroflexi bacterium]|nr:SUMF1/EgtB/PvdO family nonheme iron enzyme [Chloroflexota bacterium]